jgi:hypothetical protein
MNKRRLVPADRPGSIKSFAIYDDIIEKYRSVIEWEAVGCVGAG